MGDNSTTDDESTQAIGYEPVEVEQVGTRNYIRLSQEGDGRRDEVFIRQQDLEDVVEEMWQKLPGGASD